LNQIGEEQAQCLQERLASFTLDAAYCSDLQRARRTAEIGLSGHPSGLVPEVTPLLREVGGGEFEGRTWNEISEHFPELATQWRENRATVSPPGGENLIGVAERLRRFLDIVEQEHPDQNRTVLIVAHGGVVGVMLCLLMGTDLNRIWQWRVDSCSLTILDIYPKGPILSLFNDVSHLEKD
jgi:broad specificity phosphatase PhoE